jgi:hypothetical protein
MLILYIVTCVIGLIGASSNLLLTNSANFQLLAGEFDVSGSNTDGNQVVNSQLRSPWSIWGDRKGQIYFSDPKSHTIRVVSTSGDGSIHVFAGTTDVHGPAGNANAVDSKFNRPHGIFGDVEGNKLWICDTMNNVVREIDVGKAPFPVTTIGKLF